MNERKKDILTSSMAIIGRDMYTVYVYVCTYIVYVAVR